MLAVTLASSLLWTLLICKWVIRAGERKIRVHEGVVTTSRGQETNRAGQDF